MMSFAPCEICGSDRWTDLYRGAVRDGAFGSARPNGLVALCGGCGAGRMAEDFCLKDEDYESPAYRAKLQQALDVAKHKQEHDAFQRFSVAAIEHLELRDSALADIGCAAGTFLDYVRGLTGRSIGIEPNSYFHESLRTQGTEIYPYAADAAKSIAGQVDIATAFQVIEHTKDPRRFLEDVRPLLKPDGVLVLTTPNRKDILLDLLPIEFAAFFYRTVHRWYFSAESLAACAQAAGYRVEGVRFMHRYGLSNAMTWMRDKRPSGWSRLPGITDTADQMWKLSLQQSGQADNLAIYLKPA